MPRGALSCARFIPAAIRACACRHTFTSDLDTYGENRTEYPPRIYGWMKTNAAGGFELRTIHPGCYPGMRVPAHVHFVLWGGGYPLQWTEELKFEGGRYITPGPGGGGRAIG